ncbi:glycosyltransferase [Sphingomonas sp.]|uniref:glycosyltransferase n=1 Tax=Sphingomonas sp. TaxID=28214 RepID=UPI003CC578AD
MKLSVVLPTWNGARFLRPQLDSILAQSDPDFELLAIDDGSTDETVAILDAYAQADRRIRRLPAQGNRGQNRRLIELIDAARGEFVAIADQDDVWGPDRNARLLAAIGDRALALGRSQLIDGDGADLGRSVLEAKGVDAARVGPLTALFVPLVSAHAAVIRRSWLDSGSFYGALPFDQALGLEALFSTGLIYVGDALVQHRIHGGNQMNGDVGAAGGRTRALSLFRARGSLGIVPAGRVQLYQTFAQLGRSGALTTDRRKLFRELADLCWGGWFALGASPGAMRRALHDRLSGDAATPADLVFFSHRIGSLSRSRWTPGNLALAWRAYRTSVG